MELQEGIKEIREKLNPARFPNMSDKMAAIVNYILRKSSPIVELNITSDGYVLAKMEDMRDWFIGTKSDLEDNWNRLLTAAGLDKFEQALANLYYEYRVHSLYGG